MRAKRLVPVLGLAWLVVHGAGLAALVLRGPDPVTVGAAALFPALVLAIAAVFFGASERRARTRLSHLGEAVGFAPLARGADAQAYTRDIVAGLCHRLDRSAGFQAAFSALPRPALLLDRAGHVLGASATARTLDQDAFAALLGGERDAQTLTLSAGRRLVVAQNMRAIHSAFTESKEGLGEHEAGAGGGAQTGDGPTPMDTGDLPLSDSEFRRVRERLYAIAGIALSDAKRTLVVSRLSKLVRERRLNSFASYLDFLERGGERSDEQAFVNALTTNLTRFYREDHHFDHLIEHVGRLMAHPPRRSADGRPRLRIWSAGCSTGQEAYTIALCLLDAYPDLKRWDFKILATDIDSAVVERAARGVYPASELKGLAPERARLFERGGSDTVRIPAAARDLITFKVLNLMAPWPFKGPFDAVFCRNVAIYFDKPAQGRLFDGLGELLAPEAFLYIGHSENLGAVSKGFRLVGRTTYQRIKAAGTRDAA